MQAKPAKLPAWANDCSVFLGTLLHRNPTPNASQVERAGGIYGQRNITGNRDYPGEAARSGITGPWKKAQKRLKLLESCCKDPDFDVHAGRKAKAFVQSLNRLTRWTQNIDHSLVSANLKLLS